MSSLVYGITNILAIYNIVMSNETFTFADIKYLTHALYDMKRKELCSDT